MLYQVMLSNFRSNFVLLLLLLLLLFVCFTGSK